MLKSLPQNNSFLIVLFFFMATISSSANDLAVDDVFVFCLDQINISLGPDGTATIGPEHVTAITEDPASLDFINVTPNFFDCDDVGTNFLYTVNWSEGGVVYSCTGRVLIEDKMIPLLTCLELMNVSIDNDGMVELTNDFLVATAIDNCPLTYTVNPSSINCTDVGSTILVTVEATDPGGNTNICQSSVLVEDKIAPTAICISDLIIDLAGNPSVSILSSAIDAGSYDNCSSSLDLSLSQSTFTLADLGDNSINMTVTDDSGNSNLCITTIRVINSVPDYCVANGLSTVREFIKKIKFRAINNFSGDNGGYADFTSMEARVRRGRSYNIQLKPGFHGNRRRQHWRVWIDWNQNQIFEPSEKVAQGRSKFNITRSIDVPVSATVGTTRMRVMMKRGGYGNPCAVFSRGEVEDYSVYVRPIAPALISQQPSNEVAGEAEAMVKIKESISVNLFPNPARDVLTIESLAAINGQMSIYNSLGELVYAQELNQVSKETIELSTTLFKSGTYILLIQSAEGRKAHSFVVVK